ncbi:MAG: ATP-binding protein [Proteobacteria bacterium]|nr:ATP-binding protein [Pseudomonadota bacterium]
MQHLDEAGLFIKGLVDREPGVPIMVTGSSSYHLGARTRESLAGRVTRAQLLPLSFNEITRDLVDKSVLMRESLAMERFERHLIWGGYPEVWLSDVPETLLVDLVNAFILRDASDFFRIGRPDAFRGLLRLAAGQVCSLVNYAEWSSILGIKRDTVVSYVEILESSHVVAQVRPFVGGKRSELTSRPKLYFVDNGIRNQLVGELRSIDEIGNSGPMMENWVFSELAKSLPHDATLHFWRSTSGAEVDFVIAFPNRLVGIEVKAQRLSKPRLSRASRSFIDAYRPSCFVVVNRALEHMEELGETTLKWTTPPKLLTACFD